jgi:hypothetical protein
MKKKNDKAYNSVGEGKCIEDGQKTSTEIDEVLVKIKNLMS